MTPPETTTIRRRPPLVGLDELDVDGDGDLACGDDCDDTEPDVNTSTAESSVAACSDGLDNDCDGDIDGDDSDCEEFVGDDDDDTAGDDDDDDDDTAGDDDDDTTGDDDDDTTGDDDDTAGDDDDDSAGDDDDSAGPPPYGVPECSCTAGGGAASPVAALMLLLLCGLGWTRRESLSIGG
jgi:MYXO-CTERM domain-containing protein